MAPVSFLDDVRAVLSQSELVPALRAVLFLFGFFGALAWARRRFGLSVFLLALGGSAGLCFWLIQIDSPLGLGVDPVITREWSQAGVNSAAEPRSMGFVWGTTAEWSLVAALVSAGVPLGFVHHVPQIAVLGGFVLTILVPWILIRNRARAAWTAALLAGGGLWPDLSGFGALALKPSLLGIACLGIGLAVLAGRSLGLRRALRSHDTGIAVGLVGLAALARAFQSGGGADAVAWLGLALLTLLQASRLRTAARLMSGSSAGARRLESVLLLCVFCGGSLFWWNPPRSLPGFLEARDKSVTLGKPLRFISENTPPESVILASPDYSAPIAALAHRRVLFAPRLEDEATIPGPPRRARLLAQAHEGRPTVRLAGLFSVTHLLLGPGEPTPPLPDPATEADLDVMSLAPIYQDAKDFRVFRLVKKK